MASIVGVASLIEPRRQIAAPVYYVSLGRIFHNENLTFEQGKLQACWVLRNSDWLRNLPDFDPVHMAVDDLADTKSPEEFAVQFEAIRDHADYHRVRLDLISA